MAERKGYSAKMLLLVPILYPYLAYHKGNT